MDGHHPDLALALVLFALDLDLADLELGDQALQIAHAAAFSRQGLGQESVDGLFGLLAQPGEEAGPDRAGALDPAEQAGVEVKRRPGGAFLARPGHQLQGRAPVRAFCGAGPQGVPQPALPPAIGEVEQAVLVDITERAAQQGREAQVVPRVEAEPGQCGQVIEDDVVREREPVGAAHRHIRLLQGPDDLLEQRPSPADQDQHVPGMHRAQGLTVLVEHRLAAGDHGLDLQSDPTGELLVAVLVGDGVDRVLPGVGIFGRVGHLQRPYVDRPEPGVPVRQVDRGIARPGLRPQRLRRPQVREHRVDEAQHLGCRAPALQQSRTPERPPGARHQHFVVPGLLRQAFGRCALE